MKFSKEIQETESSLILNLLPTSEIKDSLDEARRLGPFDCLRHEVFGLSLSSLTRSSGRKLCNPKLLPRECLALSGHRLFEAIKIVICSVPMRSYEVEFSSTLLLDLLRHRGQNGDVISRGRSYLASFLLQRTKLRGKGKVAEVSNWRVKKIFIFLTHLFTPLLSCSFSIGVGLRSNIQLVLTKDVRWNLASERCFLLVPLILRIKKTGSTQP